MQQSVHLLASPSCSVHQAMRDPCRLAPAIAPTLIQATTLCSPAPVLPCQLLDRLSKGVREAPSKALISELAAQSGDSAAAAFSLRQSLATAGALLGGGVATLAFKLSGGNYVLTFALACIPAVVALLLVISAFGGGRGEVAGPGGRLQSASE